MHAGRSTGLPLIFYNPPKCTTWVVHARPLPVSLLRDLLVFCTKRIWTSQFMQPRARATLFPKKCTNWVVHAAPPPLGWALNSIRPPPASAPRPKLLSPGSGVWGCQPALWGAAGDPVGREPAPTMSRGSSGRAYGIFAFGSLRGRGRCGSCVGRLRGCFMGPNVDPLRGLCGGGGCGRTAQAVKKCIRNPELRTKVDL